MYVYILDNISPSRLAGEDHSGPSHSLSRYGSRQEDQSASHGFRDDERQYQSFRVDVSAGTRWRC
ncbi:hypothetical protein I7I48_03389 [Histoplasma ohiense]|nr:hypothetical protein I7I48_03389 [Histoplasma ohiense (nom. inval.)]